MQLISIIIPVYNTPVIYLDECLRSIAEAGLKDDYEILLINDGSTNPETCAYLSAISQADTLIINKQNGGVSSARNAGLKVAKGDLVFFLDSDDILLPAINKAISFLHQNPDYDLVYSDSLNFGDENKREIKSTFSAFKLLYLNNYLNSCSVFRKNNFLFDEDLHYAEDWDFWARMAASGLKFKYIPDPFFKYRKIKDGISLSQKNYRVREEIRNKIADQFVPSKHISVQEINQYVLNNFRDNKKQILKLFLIIFFPGVFKWMTKMKIFRNNIVTD